MKKRLFLGVLVFIFFRAALAMDAEISVSDDADEKLSQDDIVMALDSYRTHLMIHSVGDPHKLAPRCTTPGYFERLHKGARPFLEKLFNEPESLTKRDLPAIDDVFLLPKNRIEEDKPYLIKNYRRALAAVYEIYSDIAQTFIHNEDARRVIVPLVEVCIARINAGLLPEDGYASQDNFNLRRIRGLALRVAGGFKFLTIEEFTDLVGRCVFMAASCGELHEKAPALSLAMQKIQSIVD
jgi:hypothetical protein